MGRVHPSDASGLLFFVRRAAALGYFSDFMQAATPALRSTRHTVTVVRLGTPS
jgi:hypothetical protein